MKTLVRIFIALSLFYSTVLFAQQVLLRTSVTPEIAWIGQKVILNVDVLVNEGWAQILKLDTASPDDVYLLQMETQGTRISETIDGVSYTGQRYELMLFSRAEGVIEIPAIPVDVEVKTWGADGGTSVQQLQTPAASFTARAPADTKGIRGLVSTTQLSADQIWDPEAIELQTGDAIQRTIRLQADEVPGMLFAPVSFAQVEGVGIYQKEPTVADRYNRGELSGTRQEAVSYVFEQAGTVEIPAVNIYWWNVSAEQLEKITLDGLKVQVLPVSSASDADADLLEAKSRPYLLLAFGALLGIAALVLLYRERIKEYWAAYKAKRHDSEPAVFDRLIKSLRTRDARSSLRDLMRWIDRIDYSTHSPLLHEFIVKYGDTKLKQGVDELIRCVTEGNPIPSSSAIIKPLKRARKVWRKDSTRRQSVVKVLPELN